MPLLTIDQVLKNRLQKLNSLSSSVSSTISLNQAQPTSSVSTLATPPGKKIFSIVCWNVQDYKDKKMSNPFVNGFVRLVADRLDVDLLILIETDYDLTELAGNIEGENSNLFGQSVTSTNTPTTPIEDWSDITDEVKRKNYVEKMAGELAKYWLFASEVAHRYVELPQQFGFTDLQKGKFDPKSKDWREWVEMLESLKYCYQINDLNIPAVVKDYDALIQAALKNPVGFMQFYAPNIHFTLYPACPGCKGNPLLGPKLCMWCKGSGQISGVDCQACGGNFQMDLTCGTCDGSGSFNAETEINTLETLREVVQRTVISGIDTETYTMFWRMSDKQPSSRFIVSSVPAIDKKAVWLNPGGCGLTSTDVNGQELGYQNPKSKFNGRSPYVVPLEITIDRQRVFVPLAILHSIWGIGAAKKGASPIEKAEVKKKNKASEEGRVESVVKMTKLGVLKDGKRVAIENCPDFILMGDLNLDYKPTAKRGYDVNAYKEIGQSVSSITGNQNDLIVPIIGGTKSVFSPPEVGIRKNLKDIYTNAYDQFLVNKSGAVFSNVVNTGVLDVMALLVDVIKADTKMQNWLDLDMQSQQKLDFSKTPLTNEVRAFYLYRQYVSDHLPIILDILVDETSPEQQQKVNLQMDLSLPIPSNNPPLPEQKSQSYYGIWTDLQNSMSNQYNTKQVTSQTLNVIGRVTGVSYPDLITVQVGDTNSLRFFGKADTKAISMSKIQVGQWVEGVYEDKNNVVQHTPLIAVNIEGKWETLIAAISPCSYQFDLSNDKKQLKVTARVVEILLPDQISLEIPYENMRRIFRGKWADLSKNYGTIKIGNWMRGLFTLK